MGAQAAQGVRCGAAVTSALLPEALCKVGRSLYAGVPAGVDASAALAAWNAFREHVVFCSLCYPHVSRFGGVSRLWGRLKPLREHES